MTRGLDRRALLRGGALGPGALALAGAARAAGERGFTHGVASGDPGVGSVRLWTRYVGAGGATPLTVVVARDEGLRRVVWRGRGAASPEADGCVSVTAQGLRPGAWLFYAFTAPDGTRSPVGRTRTLPAKAERFTVAVVSCANLESGWFNAYRHLAERDDVDLVLHLGDYIYEYGANRPSQAGRIVPGRTIAPATEITALADYRQRYASYRSDPDLQALHRRLPMIAVWDDHEVANNSWTGGADNHQNEDGDWSARKSAGMRAFHEWLPMPEAPYASYQVGDLLSLFRLETRLTGRTRQLELAEALQGARDPAAAMAAFKAGPLADPARTMMGPAQEAWLAEGLKRSATGGTRWQVLAQQTVMGGRRMPETALDWFGAEGPPAAERARLTAAITASRAGLPLGFDAWDGYPAARARLLRAAQGARANLVTLSGDSHNAWAFELAQDGRPAGVEFAGHAVSSSGFEGRFTGPPEKIAADLVAALPELRWCDTSRRGYMTVTFTRDRADAEWVMLDTVRSRSTAVASRARASTIRGTGRLTLA